MKQFFAILLPFIFSFTSTHPVYLDTLGYYLGDKASSQYSGLTQIDKNNVHQLKVAWTYSSNDKDPDNRSQIQCNPLIVDGILYGT